MTEMPSRASRACQPRAASVCISALSAFEYFPIVSDFDIRISDFG
jgi:hypothetical protein